MTAGRPLVVLVVGIPGAGKTTVAAALAARFPRSACIEGDLVQHRFTVNGLVPPSEPSAESDRQLDLRWRNCADLARNFWADGFTVVVEHAAMDRRWIDVFLARSAPAPVSLVVLAPRAEVAAARDRARADKQVAHLFPGADAELRAALAGVGWWLDTSDLDVGQTVDAIVAHGLSAGRLR